MDKIDELQNMATKAKDMNQQYQGYLNDAQALWNVIETNGLTSREDWEAMGETLGKTNITSEMLDMLHVAEETGLSTEYYASLEALLDRYSEMLEQESDWVKLVEKEIFQAEVCYFGIAFGVEVDFVVRVDMSIAIGSNLEYEVGKRYEFWFKIGLFSPSAGSSTMDLLDEHFGFQFYVMGRLGLKAGIAAKLYVGLGSGDFASVGIFVELGPYIKLYGFFVYEYTKYRYANTNEWISNQRMGGALFMEFGLYIIMGFEANALGDLFEYSYEFLDEEIPLLTAGIKRYYYGLDYKAEADEVVLVQDSDGSAINGITMALPDYTTKLNFMDLISGVQGLENKPLTDYNFTMSNPNFTIDKNTGMISVTVPEGVGYMESDLTITYKKSKLPFSYYDMSTTVPLVWTNMSTEELSEFYNATVRVGNDADGYETVWSERLLKNKQYTLPTAEEIFKLMSWSDYKYALGTGYGDIQTENLTLVEDMQYDFNIQHKTYSVTVTGVQKADGTTESRTYYAKYGEAFDFSDLTDTGTVDYTNGVFTAYADLLVEGGIDIKRTINAKLAEALNEGIPVQAEYRDCGITATFDFTGFDAENVVMKLRRGDTPDISGITKLVTDAKMAITAISPAVGMLTGSTTYFVTCQKVVNDDATLTFIENGGSEVDDITLPWDSLIQLPTPQREGYGFDGWYTDAECTDRFTATVMPEGGATVYAKWIANSYKVTFNLNGGNALSGTGSLTVTYDRPYGTLPTATRTNYGFIGWFTAASGGTQVTADTLCTLTENQTLYAQWRQLKSIPRAVFSFTSQSYNYAKGVSRTAGYTFTPESDAMYTEGEFTIEYICQAYTSEGYFPSAIQAGTYNVRVTREADEYYNRFQATYENVLVINKVTRSLNGIKVSQTGQGLTYMKLKLTGTIDDMDANARIQYVVDGTTSSAVALSSVSMIEYLAPGTNYTVTVKVTGDRNYNYNDYSTAFSTKSVSNTKWSANYDTSWSTSGTTLTVTTPAQLAAVAFKIRAGLLSGGKTIELGANLDMSAYTWIPIENFKGTFDGKGYTISGLYYKGNDNYAGLFASTSGATIKNVVVDDSYFDVSASVGISSESAVGGIVGKVGSTSKIYNCVSHAVLVHRGSRGAKIGGIVGTMDGGESKVVNCVNYGKITSGTIMYYCIAGGIVGHCAGEGGIFNCVNFGPITVYDHYVGGIAGYAAKKNSVQNCYNAGTINVESPISSSFAILGNTAVSVNMVAVDCYYLSGSAMKDSNGINDKVYSFTNLSSTITGSNYQGTLLTVLNGWVSKNTSSEAVTWTASGPNGYPIPSGSPVSALRK